MKRKKLAMVLAMCLGVMLIGQVARVAAESEPRVGLNLGNVSFAAPISAEDATYLGLAGQKPFTLRDIKAPYVIVESMYTACAYCMAQAPVLNKLYRLVAGDPSLRNQIKFVAAAQGQDERAAARWKKFQHVPFAVVPDSGRRVSSAMNFTPYPVTMLVDKSGTVRWVHVGEFRDASEALQGIKRAVR